MLNRYRTKSSIGGSNPPLSATPPKAPYIRSFLPWTSLRLITRLLPSWTSSGTVMWKRSKLGSAVSALHPDPAYAVERSGAGSRHQGCLCDHRWRFADREQLRSSSMVQRPCLKYRGLAVTEELGNTSLGFGLFLRYVRRVRTIPIPGLFRTTCLTLSRRQPTKADHGRRPFPARMS